MAVLKAAVTREPLTTVGSCSQRKNKGRHALSRVCFATSVMPRHGVRLATGPKNLSIPAIFKSIGEMPDCQLRLVEEPQISQIALIESVQSAQSAAAEVRNGTGLQRLEVVLRAQTAARLLRIEKISLTCEPPAAAVQVRIEWTITSRQNRILTQAPSDRDWDGYNLPDRCRFRSGSGLPVTS